MDKVLFAGKKSTPIDLTLSKNEIRKTRRKKRKSLPFLIAKYVLYFVGMIFTFFARTGGITPFSQGLYLSLSYLGENVIVLSLLFVVASLCSTGQFLYTISVMICAISVCATTCIFIKAKKKIPLWVVLTLGFIGQVCGFYFADDSVNTLRFALEIVLSPLFTYLCVCAFNPIVNEGARYKILPTVVACLGVVTSALACGTTLIDVGYVKVYYVLLILCIGLGIDLFGKSAGCFCGLSLGLGNALATYDLGVIAFACFISGIFALFFDAPRPVPVIATLIGATGFSLYFDFGYLYLTPRLVSLAIGGVLYCIIPRRELVKLGGFFSKKDSRAVRSLINGVQLDVADEMRKTGAVFVTMGKSLRHLTSSISAKQDELVIKVSKVCGDCTRCDRSPLKTLIDVTAEKGRVTVNEVADLIRCDCPKVAQLISVADEEVNSVKKRAKATLERDKKREESAIQLENVGGILREKAQSLCVPYTSNVMKEDALVEELTYHGIPAVDAMSCGENGRKIVVVLAKSPNDDGEKVAQIAGKVYRSAYAVDSIIPAMLDDYKVVSLKEKTAYDVTFATSAVSKNSDATGDAHSFIRISETKFMMALCDGMGSGEKAGKTSERAIDLVESFFRAGFDSAFVVENVNRFLVFDEEENFVAFDILVCDLNTLERTIIKMGSATSYLRRKEGVMKLDGNALPMGALSEIKPFVSIGKSEENEIVLFMSDGVTDVLGEQRIAEIIASHSVNSLRALCDDVINEAKRSSSAVSDDMSVIASRIIRRI